MTNKEIANMVLIALKAEKFIPVDIAYHNGYFIFDMGEDSVVHFHIKGIRGWKFGLWIDAESDKDTAQLFAQYEELIDKFKPSRSFFVVSIDKNSLERAYKTADYSFYGLLDMVKHIKHNPHLALVQDCGWYSAYISEPLWLAYLHSFKIVLDHKMRRLRKYLIDGKLVYLINSVSAKIVNRWHDDVLKYVEVIDNNQDGFICSPRWEVVFWYNRISDDDDTQGKAMNELIDKLNKYYILFTKKNTSYTNLVKRKEGGYERW